MARPSPELNRRARHKQTKAEHVFEETAVSAAPTSHQTAKNSPPNKEGTAPNPPAPPPPPHSRLPPVAWWVGPVGVRFGFGLGWLQGCLEVGNLDLEG